MTVEIWALIPEQERLSNKNIDWICKIPDRNDINTSRDPLKSWPPGGNPMDPEKENKQYEIIEHTTMSLLLQGMRSMSGWPDSSMKVDDWTYLKCMFQLEAGSWLVDLLDGCWHDAHSWSEDNSQKNLGEKILHDESSNTTLGGIVKLDEQREQ
jgi:hypothetical protein